MCSEYHSKSLRNFSVQLNVSRELINSAVSVCGMFYANDIIFALKET